MTATADYDWVRDLTLDEVDALIAQLAEAGDDDALDALALAIEKLTAWTPYPHQIAPDGDFSVWGLMGGRGCGKTDGGANTMNAHALGPACDDRLPGGHRMRIIAPTHGDAIAACVNGPSGLKVHNPAVDLVGTKEGTLVRWPNGAIARVFGAHTPNDVERLRAGGNSCFDWYEELAAWRWLQDAWDQARFGLRVGSNPQAIFTTTPKNRPLIRLLVRRAEAAATLRWVAAFLGTDWRPRRRDRVVITHATTDDNPALDAEVREELYDTYAGTRLGEQELGGKLLDDLGTFFSAGWFGYRDDPAPYPVRVRAWDFAATPPGPGNDDPDWTVGLLLAWDPVAKSANITDVVRGRWSSSERDSVFVATVERDGPNVVQVIEQEPGSSGVDQVQHMRSLVAHISHVRAVRPTGAKEVRAQLPSLRAEQRRVTLTRADWNQRFLDECEEFPNGAHDDQVDTLSLALGFAEGKLGRPVKSTGAQVAQARIGNTHPGRVGRVSFRP